MKLLQRLGYYLAGFSLGLIFLAFIFNGKKTSCNYSPSARVKNDLIQKEIRIDSTLAAQYPDLNPDQIKSMIEKGNVNFKKSDTQRDSCRIYFIETEGNKEGYLQLENCARTVTVIGMHLR